MKILYGDAQKDNYLIVDETDGIFIVHVDYFNEEHAVLFKVADKESDWSRNALLTSAKSLVDIFNATNYHPERVIPYESSDI